MKERALDNQKLEIGNPPDLSALVFDFGGTLDGPGTGWYERLFFEAQGFDESITYQSFLALAKRSGKALDHNPDAPRMSLSHTVQNLVEHIVEAGNLAARGVYTKTLADKFISDAGAYLEESREILAALAPHYRLACISNNWGNAAGWCAEFGLDRYFEFVIDSNLVNIRKPDARIFHLALEKLNLPPEQVGYVGDQFQADVFGSKSVGMKSIWVEGRVPKPCPDESLVDYRLSSLAELLAWVNGKE